MSAWRQKFLESFPRLRTEFEDPETSIYQAFFLLLPVCREAHEANDVATLQKIYAFAEWCFSQRSGELRNAAAVAFYEHLVDNPVTMDELPRWVPPDVFEAIQVLLVDRTDAKGIERLRARYSKLHGRGNDPPGGACSG